MLAVLFALIGEPCHAAVARIGTPASQFAVSNTLSSFTVAAGVNRLLLVTAADPLAVDVSGVTFAGTAMTRATQAVNDVAVASIWYLPLGSSATATSGNVVMTSAGGEQRFLAATVFEGVLQQTPVNSPQTARNDFSGNSSLTLTSSAGDMTFDLFASYSNGTTPTASFAAGQTLVSQGAGAIPSLGAARFATSTKAGASSVAMSWTSSGQYSQQAGINIRQSPLPDLTLTKAAVGSSFVRGGSASFTLTVNNIGDGATSGSYTVSDVMPAGLTATAASGSGWSCTVASGGVSVGCSRSAAIASGASAPAIQINTSIATNAANAAIQNSATVAGGNEINTANNAGTASINLLSPATITVPVGLAFSFNGTGYSGTQTVNVAPGNYSLATTSPQALATGARAVFASWSDAGAMSHVLTVGAAPLSVAGVFTTQYQLTTTAGSGGSVMPLSGQFFDAGTVVNVTATPASGYFFTGWTGPVANAAQAATTVTMDAPKTVAASFSNMQTVTITVPAAASFSFGGSNFVGPQTLTRATGNYTLSTTTPQSVASGTRLAFSSWSDAGAIAHNVSVGATPVAVTGNFTTQYQLTVNTTAGGTATPASGQFYDAGAVVDLVATPGAGYVFSQWTGAVANTLAAATTVAMDAAKTVTANFIVAPPVVTANPGDVSVTAGATASFSAAAGGTAPVTVQWQVSTNQGQSFGNLPGASSVPLAFTATAADHGKRYRAVFSNGGGSTPTSPATLSVTVNAMLNIDNSNAATSFDAATDGVLLIRYLLGYRDAALIADVRGNGSFLRDAAAIQSHIAGNLTAFDVDGDGQTLALTDGLMILRRLLLPSISPTDATGAAIVTANAKNSARSDQDVLLAIDALMQ